MIATITKIDWTDSPKTGIPYGCIKATAVQGDPNAALFDDDDCINPMACMSRTFNLTKCLFPPSIEMANNQKIAYIKGKKVRLGLFSIPAPKKFNIQGSDGELLTEKKKVMKAYTAPTVVGNVVKQAGELYEVEEDFIKTYDSISLVLFVNKEGVSVENPGETVEAVALRTYNANVSKGTYIPVD